MTKKNKKEIVKTNFFKMKTILFEEIYKEGEYWFIRYDTKKDSWKYIKEFTYNNVDFFPIKGEEVEKDVVTLPDMVEEYGTIEELEKEIAEHITTWLDVDDEFKRLAVWNIMFSWVYDRFHTLNYLRALGDTGTGKSRFLDVLGRIHYTPMMVSGALTPAPIFRIIDKWHGTLLIDEGDQKDSDAENAFIKILNCGYERNRSVMRCDQNDANKLNFFKVYCPKVITTRKRFDDKATEARCLTQIMRQTTRTDIPDVLTEKYFEESKHLRRKLLLYRLRNYLKINPEAGNKVDLSKYEPRLRQVNRGFISLFAHKKEEIEKFKLFLDEYQQKIIEERADSFDGGIIQSIAELLVNGYNNMTPTQIAEYCNTNYPSVYTIYPKTIGKHAKTLGLIFKRKKVNGETKNVLLQETKEQKQALLSNFKRYIINEETISKLVLKGYDVTTVTVVMQSRELGVANRTVAGTRTSTGEVTETGAIQYHRNYRNTVTQDEQIHHNCSKCKATESFAWGYNQEPLCKKCYDQLMKEEHIK